VLLTVFVYQIPNIPIEAVSSAGVALLIGGGVSVAEAMVFSMISDISTDKWRYALLHTRAALRETDIPSNRTLFFQIVICSFLLSEIFGSLAALAMIDSSAGTALLASLAFNGVGFLLAVFLPETLHMRRTNPLGRSGSPVPPRDRVSFRQSFHELWLSIKTAWWHMRRKQIALLVPAAALTIPLATATANLLARVIPARSDTVWSDSLVMAIVRTVTTILVLVVGLPLIFCCFPRNVFCRDLTLAKFFGVFLIVGMFVMGGVQSSQGTTAGVIVLTLGAAVPGLTRSLLSQMIARQHLGGFFGLMALLEQAGYLLIGSVMNSLYSAGLSNGGGEWAGLPFYFSGVLLCIVWICLLFAKPSPLEEDEDIELATLERTAQ
jgi:hypothetical protein